MTDKQRINLWMELSAFTRTSLSKLKENVPYLGTFLILTNLYFTWTLTCSLPYTSPFGGKITLHTWIDNFSCSYFIVYKVKLVIFKLMLANRYKLDSQCASRHAAVGACHVPGAIAWLLCTQLFTVRVWDSVFYVLRAELLSNMGSLVQIGMRELFLYDLVACSCRH